MDKYQDMITIISLTVSLIATLITLIRNTGFSKNYERERRYYEKVLMPFLEKYAKNSDFDIIKFCKNKIKRTDEDIPMYVIFLMDHREEDKLKKVLLLDYTKLYKNDINTVNNITTLVDKILFCIMLIWEFFFILLGSLLIVGSALEMLNNKTISLLGNIILGIIIYGISLILMKCDILWHDDTYALNTKKIQKHIANKTKSYEKKKDKYYFIH